jgi:hypothetical protein
MNSYTDFWVECDKPILERQVWYVFAHLYNLVLNNDSNNNDNNNNMTQL